RLVDERAHVVVTDPQALDNARQDLAELGTLVEFEEDPYRAAEGAHAIAVLTGWSVYRDLDYARIFDSMAKPAWLFDGRNLLGHQELVEIGFNVSAVGKKPLTRFPEFLA
ncbi:MAG: UDP binding domain-containing protein, partial [Acidobacteriota bacterium]